MPQAVFCLFRAENCPSYRERDIDRDQEARVELKRRTGGSSIPTLEIDGELLQPGFSEQSVERALLASVERRLGVTGIRIQHASN
ncbi:MAG TPA: glutaredoxin family protein [Polyangiaceae bacterium]